MSSEAPDTPPAPAARPPARSRGQELIARFLGAAGSSPFALLGIEPTACTPSSVEAALERQLDRISQHPDADTPEADEVRLVLDTAATELLDPVSRARWIAEHQRSAAAAEATVESPVPRSEAPGASVPAPTATPAREAAAGVAADAAREPRAGLGGDPLVKRTLLVLGVGFGVMMIGLLLGVWLLSAAGVNGGGVPGEGTRAGADGAGAPADGTAGGPSAVSVGESATPLPPPPPPLAPLRERGRSEFADGDLMVRELRAAATEIDRDPDRALSRFERAFVVVADHWCRYALPQRRAAADAVVECVYRASARPDHIARLVAIITEPAGALSAGERAIGADEVWPAAWSAGVLARINRERELPPQVSGVLSQAMTRALGRARLGVMGGELSLESGTAAAMRVMPAAILAGPASAGQDPDAIGRAKASLARWEEGVALTAGDAAGADGEERRERQLVDALAWALVEPADPDVDRRVFEAQTFLGASIKWRSGSAARAALMDWFRDPRVSTADLHTLTSAIAGRSGAEGVDPSMVLSMSPSGDDRAQLRARYAAAWGLAEASTRADAAREWVLRARAAAEHEPRNDELDHLAAAADLAELSREAVKIWRGESRSGGVSGSGVHQPIGAAPGPGSGAGSGKIASGVGATPGTITGTAADGAWAERYMAAERNIPVRLERLKELEDNGGPIGFIDAGVLLEAACFSSPVQVRSAAQRVVGRFADEATVVTAALDVLPNAPRIRSVSDMMARVGLVQLPRPTDASWELTARRGLVERLLAMIADDGIHGQIEQMASRIAEAYLDAAGEPPAGSTTDASAVGARRGAEILLEMTRREAQGLPITRATRLNIDQIDRRAAQRRMQALGPVQGFGAEQAALAEMLGYLIASERPERESGAASLLEQMAVERRRARHVFTQIWTAERTIVRLWLLRLDTEGAS